MKRSLWSRDLRLSTVVVGVLCLVGALAIAVATSHGPWAYSDSVAYVAVAENVAKGTGLGMVQASGDFVPLVHYPPLYPLVLAVGTAIHVDVLDVARWLNIALFAATLLLVGWATRRLFDSRYLETLPVLVVLTSPVLLYLFSGAMSEPLFIVLSLASLLILAEGMAAGRLTWVILAGALAGLASLTRYAGLAVALTGSLALVVLGHRLGVRRLRAISIYVALALGPLGIWLGMMKLLPAGSAARTLTVPAGSLWEAARPFRADLADAMWRMAPFSSRLPHPPYWLIHLALIALVLGSVTVGILGLVRSGGVAGDDREEARRLRLLVLVLSSYALVYLGTVAAAFLFTVPTPDIDERMLSPLLVPIWLSGYCALIMLVRPRWGIRSAWVLTGIVAAILVSAALPEALWTLRELQAEGRGYTSVGWRTSETVRALESLPAGTPLISNEGAAIYLLTGRLAYDLPQVQMLEAVPSFSRFGDDNRSQEERVFRRDGAALILFDTALARLEPLYGARASERLAQLTDGLSLYVRLRDGAIYFYPETE